MKLRGLLTLLVGALLLGVGCTTDADINTSGAGSEGKIKTVKITATLPELGGTTRAEDSAKGGITNVDWDTYELRVIIKAYGAEGDTFAGQYATGVVDYKDKDDIVNGNISVDVGLPLTTGHKFDIYLWADYVLKSAPTADLHYNTAEFPAITLAGESPTLVINDESYDAFFGKGTVNVSEIATMWDTDTGFSVQRAVAKLRMIATDAASATATNATLQTDKFYTGFNIATDDTSLSLSTPMLSARTAFEAYSTETAPDTKSFITAYLLWPAVDEGGDATTSTIAANFYEGDNTEPVSTIAPTKEIPLKRGWLTTLRGEMFESGWDGTTLVEPMTIIDDEWLVLNNTEELAWVLEKGDTKGKNKIRITTDMDMGGYTVKPFPVHVSHFDGNNKSISNVVVNGNSLFTSDKALSIHDLNVDTITVGGDTTTGHVGVLVNRVGINATFENITIKNASATTSDGAAGGVVGYIEGGTDPALEVKFINCDLENVKSSGTLDEGIFVGRMHGYNDDEILSFDADCSAAANCAVTDFKSPYTESNDAQWLDEGDSAFDFTKYNGWLGDEENYRGLIKFEGHRMQIKWDGKKTITPMTDDSGAYLIYSPFDLANLQTKTPASVKFKTDVDLGGDYATSKNKFNPIRTISNLDGEGHTLYNLYVDMVHDGTGAAFIQTASGTTTHKNLTFIDAYIKNVHNTNIPTPAYGVTNDGGAGNAYAGTLVSHTGGDYTAENVHFKNGTVYAVCKMGGAIGYVGSTNFKMKDCSVDKYLVENYEPGVPNYYTLPRRYTLNLSSVQSMSGITSIFGVGKIPSTAEVNCLQWWYTNGECGGLIGFIKSKTATIDHCSVTNTEINCVGQDNKPVVANVWDSADFNINDPYRSGVMIFAKGNTDVAGRHVNQFIGDVVSERKEGGSDYNITVSDYTVSGNSYNGIQATSTNKYSHNYASGKYCEVVGCAYYIGVDVKLFGIDLTHVNDCAGTLTFNALNFASVTITEEVKDGNSISWTGGSFTDAEYKQKNSGSFFRPKWSYNVESYYPSNPE